MEMGEELGAEDRSTCMNSQIKGQFFYLYGTKERELPCFSLLEIQILYEQKVSQVNYRIPLILHTF